MPSPTRSTVAPGNVLLELARLAVHLVADDGAGRAADRGADDGALGGGAGDLADHAADHRPAGGADDQAALGVAGTGEGGDEQRTWSRARRRGHGA